MRKVVGILVILLISCIFVTPVSFAQRQIRVADQMYKKKLKRQLDLREKVNQPMFSQNRWITKIMLDAFRQGQLIAYTNDSLTTTLTQDEVNQKLSTQMDLGDDTEEIFLEEDGWGDEEDGFGDEDDGGGAAAISDQIFPQDLEQIYLTEEVIFDKQHSRMYFNIQSISVFIPANKTEAGIDKPVCTFDYKELAVLFADKEKALWYNTFNDAMHLSLKDAFDVRLFSSFIIKISNARNQFLADKYDNQRTAIMASDWTKNQLVEYEHHLWSF